MARFKRSTISDPNLSYPPKVTAASLFGSGYFNDAGELVTVDTALSLPSYYGLVHFLGDIIASAECPVYRKIDDFSQERDQDHWADDLLNFQANDGLSAFLMRRKLVVDCLNYGRGAAWVEKTDMGDPIAIWPLDPWNVLEVCQYDGLREWTVAYQINKQGQIYTVASEDVIDVQMPSVNATSNGKAIGLVQQLRNSFAMAQSEIKFGNKFFKQGATTGRYIRVPGWPEGQQLDQMKQMIDEIGSGLDNAHGTAVLFGGAEVMAAQVRADNAQWIESRQQSTREFCTALRLPASLANLVGNNSYSSLEQENLAVLGRCLSPWARLIESEFNVKLIKKTLRRTRFIEHSQQDFLDYISIKEENRKAYQSAEISHKEYRQRNNLPTDIDPTEFVCGSNLQNLAKVFRDGQEPEPQPTPLQPPATAGEPQENASEPQKNNEQGPEKQGEVNDGK